VGKYKVLIKPSAIKELEAIPLKKDRRRIALKIKSLGDDPRPVGGQKLSGHDRFRLRQGQYRILYEICDDILLVNVVKVGHRKDIYRDL
jgi:Cytotoxic translational repressor of toxin-antitoxin stability system